MACLHSGVFIRAQWSRFLNAHPEQVRRGVHALIASGVAAEETVPGIRGTGRVCRIFSRQLYRALGAEDIRHRRAASEAVLMRRLLPSRLYRGAAGSTWRYFPLKLPVALEAARAVFVYADPCHDTSTALRSWADAHRGLWNDLTERGRSVEVVAVVRTLEELDRAQGILHGWTEASGPDEPDAGIREEIARIERAILQGEVQILDEFGGLQDALKRSVALTKQTRRQPGRGSINRGSAWQTVRLSGAQFR